MKTNQFLVETKEWTKIEYFKKVIDISKERLIEFLSKQDDYKGTEIIEIYDAKKYHACKYCGQVTKGSDEDILCDDCIMTFRHCRYSDL